jgi:hypothetical protein
MIIPESNRLREKEFGALTSSDMARPASTARPYHVQYVNHDLLSILPPGRFTRRASISMQFHQLGRLGAWALISDFNWNVFFLNFQRGEESPPEFVFSCL